MARFADTGQQAEGKVSEGSEATPVAQSSPSQSSTTTTNPTNGARTIVGLMGVTVIFSTIGHVAKTGGVKQSGGVITDEGKIILGGFFATGILVLVAKAGDGGRQFATGLALIAMLTSTLVYGAPVWDAANNIFGSKPTTPLSGSTKPTTPTQGVQTAVALTQAA